MAKCTKFYEKQQIVSNSLFAAHFDVRFAYLAKNTKFYEKQQIVSNSLFAAHFDVRFTYLAEIGSF